MGAPRHHLPAETLCRTSAIDLALRRFTTGLAFKAQGRSENPDAEDVSMPTMAARSSRRAIRIRQRKTINLSQKAIVNCETTLVHERKPVTCFHMCFHLFNGPPWFRALVT